MKKAKKNLYLDTSPSEDVNILRMPSENIANSNNPYTITAAIQFIGYLHFNLRKCLKLSK